MKALGDHMTNVLIGDCRETLKTLADGSVNCCVTSPPYWGLRDYGHADQIGLETTPAEYVSKLVEVFREVRRVLADDGTLWLNLGDSYASGEIGRHDSVQANDGREWSGTRKGTIRKQARLLGCPAPKNLIGIPWRVAFALQADGWYLRSDIVWAKPNPMPESVTDRPTKAHEYVFLLAKSERYYFDARAIAEPSTGRNGGGNRKYEASEPGAVRGRKEEPHGGLGDKWEARDTRSARSVWTIGSEPYVGAHFATMPPALVSKCILAGCPTGGTVLDPFLGSGTVGQVAEQLGRHWIGCELNPEYAALIRQRTAQRGLFLAEVAP